MLQVQNNAHRKRDMMAKLIQKIRDYSYIIGIVLTGTTFAWCKFAIPEIDKRINAAQKPVVQALEFQNFLMMENMPDSLVERAEKKYLISQRGKVQQ